METAQRAFAYAVPVTITLFLNTLDVYFLQSETRPPLHKSPSFWFYLVSHGLFALFVAWFQYARLNIPVSQWPLVAATTAFTGFAVVRSLSLKVGHKGIDVSELFDTWKLRVIEDVSKANASSKLIKQNVVAERLAASAPQSDLEAAIHQLAPAVQLKAEDVIADTKGKGINCTVLMALWIASTDLVYAEGLLVRYTSQAKQQ